MRPAVAVFISGFNSGFVIIKVSPSIHNRLQYHGAYLQGREHEHYRRGE